MPNPPACHCGCLCKGRLRLAAVDLAGTDGSVLPPAPSIDPQALGGLPGRSPLKMTLQNYVSGPGNGDICIHEEIDDPMPLGHKMAFLQC